MATQVPDEEPLDPKVEEIRQKMMKLLMVSGGIMLVGFMALMITIVYKINQGNEQAVARVVDRGTITLPANAQLMDTALDGNRMMFTIKRPDGTQAIQIYDGDQLKGEFELR